MPDLPQLAEPESWPVVRMIVTIMRTMANIFLNIYYVPGIV